MFVGYDLLSCLLCVVVLLFLSFCMGQDTSTDAVTEGQTVLLQSAATGHWLGSVLGTKGQTTTDTQTSSLPAKASSAASAARKLSVLSDHGSFIMTAI